jgi:NAD+ synthase (glutamine-hydrolysing)
VFIIYYLLYYYPVLRIFVTNNEPESQFTLQRRKKVKIALAQINPTIGDFTGNTQKILDYIHLAHQQKAELIVFPEMCLCGYPPLDLLDYDSFVAANLKQLRTIQHALPPDIGVILGYIEKNRQAAGKKLLNVASLIYNKQLLHTQAKTLLPTYDVFDEARYFEPASLRQVFPFKEEYLGLAICEDIWWESEYTAGTRYPLDPVKELLDQGASLIISPSASPFYSGKPQIRLKLLSQIGQTSGVPVVYTNMVGGNDSLIFDGQSMVTSSTGKLLCAGAAFKEDLLMVDTREMRQDKNGPTLSLRDDKYTEIEEALSLGLKDYLAKSGFKHVHLGLSGGIDSAIVATLAVKALGKEQVTVFALPSRYSSSGSRSDAQALTAQLGIPYNEMSIEPAFNAFLTTLEPYFQGKKPDLAEENLQARIRGTLLMAYSNKFKSLLLATGNKSELATGYCTLYGDMNGSLGLIGDLFKMEVYELARSINKKTPLIPQAIIDKAPSAELRPDQKDEDSLPPYALLDQILELYLIKNLTQNEIIDSGFEQSLVSQILKMVGQAEYKRRQAPPVLKVSPRAFGNGRRMPIARHVYEADLT